MTEMGSITPATKRLPLIAALLSLMGGPIGQVYAGRFRRALLWWIFELLLSFGAAVGLAQTGVSQGLFIAIVGILVACLFGRIIDAFFVARSQTQSSLYRYQRWYVYLGLIVGLPFLNYLHANLIRTFVVEAFRVPGRAMAPTIMHEDRIVVSKLFFRPDRLKHSDLATFYSNGPKSPLYVMRVIGLPGDSIEIRDRQLIRNGQPVDESRYVKHEGVPLNLLFENFGPMEVPTAMCFFLGDNRFFAADSRTIGPIPMADVVGIPNNLFWSRDYSFSTNRGPIKATAGKFRWDRFGMSLR